MIFPSFHPKLCQCSIGLDNYSGPASHDLITYSCNPKFLCKGKNKTEWLHILHNTAISGWLEQFGYPSLRNIVTLLMDPFSVCHYERCNPCVHIFIHVCIVIVVVDFMENPCFCNSLLLLYIYLTKIIHKDEDLLTCGI